MTLPTIDGLHYVGCHCNDPCPCDDIECVHEQCICDRLSAAYRRGREDAAKALDLAWETWVPMSVVGAGYQPWYDRMIAAARGDGNHE